MTPFAVVLIALAFIVAVAIVRAVLDPKAIARRARARANRRLQQLQSRSYHKRPERTP